MLEPRSLEELMERGALYESLECFKAALDDFQSFLSQAPEHPLRKPRARPCCG